MARSKKAGGKKAAAPAADAAASSENKSNKVVLTPRSEVGSEAASTGAVSDASTGTGWFSVDLSQGSTCGGAASRSAESTALGGGKASLVTEVKAQEELGKVLEMECGP